jgi:uncharacterized membrane protein YhiD involved in acid resistance
MFGFLLKIVVCVLVVFCIHTIWQNIQENFARPRIKNTNAEIEKYKSLVQEISQQHQNKSKMREEEKKIEIPEKPIVEMAGLHDIESDLNSFLDSILIENHIETIPVVI